jgi:hypothetical protein
MLPRRIKLPPPQKKIAITNSKWASWCRYTRECEQHLALEPMINETSQQSTVTLNEGNDDGKSKHMQ